MEAWDSLLFQGKPADWARAKFLAAKAGYSDMDIEDLGRRFCPGGCRQQFSYWELIAILCLVAEGAFEMDRRAAYSAPSSELPKVPPKSQRETALHKTLKAEATHWLRSMKVAGEIVYESPYAAGISDVATSDHRWIVECGASKPSKIWTYFAAMGAELDRIAFFNDNGITIFSVGPRLSDYYRCKNDRNKSAWDAFARIVSPPPKADDRAR